MATSSGSWNGEEMPEFLRIPPSDIKIGDQIGQGGFSTVQEALWRGKRCAAKIVKTADVLSIQKEVVILSKLSHPHIMGCIGFSVDSTGDPSRCMILMELMESDLRHLINERLENVAADASPFSETEAVDILCQISSGMEYLHGQGVFHGDLKASNVLVSHDRDGKLLVKITDFGVSQMVKLDPAEKSEKFIRKKHFRGAVGTRGYQAPEVSSSSVSLSGSKKHLSVTYAFRGPEDYQRKSTVNKRKSEGFYSVRADIYCFAVTCSEILSGRVPFESVRNADIPALVLQGARPELPHGLDQGLVTLIEMCWDKKPSKRPTFGEIKRVLERWDLRYVNSSLEYRWPPLLVLQGCISNSIRASEASEDQRRIKASLQDSKERSRVQASLQDSKEQSRKKAPKWWSRLLRRFRRGNRK